MFQCFQCWASNKVKQLVPIKRQLVSPALFVLKQGSYLLWGGHSIHQDIASLSFQFGLLNVNFRMQSEAWSQKKAVNSGWNRIGRLSNVYYLYYAPVDVQKFSYTMFFCFKGHFYIFFISSTSSFLFSSASSDSFRTQVNTAIDSFLDNTITLCESSHFFFLSPKAGWFTCFPTLFCWYLSFNRSTFFDFELWKIVRFVLEGFPKQCDCWRYSEVNVR